MGHLIDFGMKMTQRPLEVIYAIDTSGSMYGENIEAVNNAMHDLESLFVDVARDNPSVDIKIRIITFGGDGANWYLSSKTKPENFRYRDIEDPDGYTPMGGAFKLLANAMKKQDISERGLRPLLVLLSDGKPNDDNYEGELDKLLATPWGKKAVKVAIAIGDDCDRDILYKFVDGTSQVLNAENARQIEEYIKWTSTIVSQVSTHQDDGTDTGNGAQVYACPNTVIEDDGLFD